MTRGSHLALAAERGELVPLPEFLERAWQIMRDEPGEPDQAARPALFLLEGGGQQRAPRGRGELRLVTARRRYRS
ncbi:MAG: hypothetical protein ABI317_12215 [Gaiellales bacterium]